MMTDKYFFNIAEHVLKVSVPLGFPLMEYLPSFNDFLIDELGEKSEALLSVLISLDEAPISSESVKVLADSSPIWGDGFRFEESPSCYITSMRSQSDLSQVQMHSSKDFLNSTIYLGDENNKHKLLISWFLMIVFGQGVLAYKTIMIHASTVERNLEEAYAFLGKSGTGKSTHSQLWLKYLTDFTLLNDDNPVLRLFDTKDVFIYGTPWSGKTSCYRDLKIKLSGIIRLNQSLFNRFELKKNTESLVVLLPSCTAIRWNKKLFNNMVDTVESIVALIPVGILNCDISEEAVNVSYKGIKNI